MEAKTSIRLIQGQVTRIYLGYNVRYMFGPVLDPETNPVMHVQVTLCTMAIIAQFVVIKVHLFHAIMSDRASLSLNRLSKPYQ